MAPSIYTVSLPVNQDLESRAILKKLAKAHQALAELKGVASSIPNQSILSNTLALQEAKDSSAIENIITTHDDVYQSDSLSQQFVTLAAKEVHAYAAALQNGFERVQRTGLLTNNDILEIQASIENNRAGFRKLPGTALKNDLTGETVYTPPAPDEIESLMRQFERFINDEGLVDWDPLTKMAVMHHQFESIHPFYDGNGRTGRILNILYLVKQGLLSSPILYLSRFINQNKSEYYRLLQAVRDTGEWESWVLFMLEGVEQTSLQTTQLTLGIKELMLKYKHKMRNEVPKIYSQDLINNLFRHPYTKIDFVVSELGVHRNTATKYLDELVRIELLSKHKIGKDNFFLNDALFQLLLNVGQK
ncbi:MAG: Fic family protein [Candidatus Sericytochromatia bacterium]|nr:Fic family protein [Candidatus Sericytochromatia bacterium]